MLSALSALSALVRVAAIHAINCDGADQAIRQCVGRVKQKKMRLGSPPQSCILKIAELLRKRANPRRRTNGMTLQNAPLYASECDAFHGVVVGDEVTTGRSCQPPPNAEYRCTAAPRLFA